MIKISHEVDLNSKIARTDLAVELTKNEARIDDGKLKITDITLDKDEAKKIGKKEGTYITIEFEDVTDYENKNKVITTLKKELTNLLNSMKIKDNDSFLIIGLGNKKSTPDSLGPKVIEKILVTNHIYMIGELDEGFRRVSKISPGVTGETGIETSDLIKKIKETIKPDFVIIIDALASSSIERLNKTIQMTDAGINPGSGIGNKRKEISKDTLNIPVIAIGVPTVVDAASIVNDTISYIYDHFAFKINNYNNPILKLSPNINYLKYRNKIKQKDKEKLLGMVGALDESQTKKLIYEILTPTGYNFMVTPKEEDFIIEKLAEVISESINSVLHKNI